MSEDLQQNRRVIAILLASDKCLASNPYVIGSIGKPLSGRRQVPSHEGSLRRDQSNDLLCICLLS
jgi:hypothetical protein